MTVYAWPLSRAFMPRTAALGVLHNSQRVAESSLNGAIQTTDMPGARWTWDLDWSSHRDADRQAIEGWVARLNGRTHRVTLWDLKRPTPTGSINTSGVTLGTAAAQFATSLTLAGCGANRTLLAGDWLGLPTGQVVMVVADAQADGAGAMVVLISPMLRDAQASGAVVTLIRPSASYMLDGSLSSVRGPGRVQAGFALRFVEAFA